MVSSQVLTNELLSQIACPPDKPHLEFFDALIRGFYVDLLRNGRMNFRLRYRVDGKARVTTLGDARVMTVDEAREAARQYLRDLKAESITLNTATPQPLLTVGEFFTEHYIPYAKSYKRSWDTDQSLIRNHIIPKLGGLALPEVMPKDIANAVSAMRAADYAPGTCNRFLVLLRYGFRLAERWRVGGLACNPAKELVNLRDDNRIERYLTPLQCETLLKEIQCSPNPMLGSIIRFLILTGARKREVLDATWVDIDFEQRLWRIPKTKSGKIRYIPLSVEALRVLNELRVKAVAGREHIFANPATGKPFISIFYSWDACRKRAGLPEFRIHDLRHSFASFLVNAGRSLYEVQQLLGHADIRTTSRYAHLSRDTLREAVEVVPLGLRAAHSRKTSS